jgi:hypothetical protein
MHPGEAHQSHLAISERGDWNEEPRGRPTTSRQGALVYFWLPRSCQNLFGRRGLLLWPGQQESAQLYTVPVERESATYLN